MDSHLPIVLWAQRKDKVYLTVEVWEVKDEVIHLTKTSLDFSGKNSETNQKYTVHIDFFDEIDPDASTTHVSHNNISFILMKIKTDEKFWPRLSKSTTKFHNIKIDFNKWKDEDEGEGDDGQFDFSKFGGANFGNPGGMDFDDSADYGMGDELANEDFKLDENKTGEEEGEEEEPLDAQIRRRQKEDDNESKE